MKILSWAKHAVSRHPEKRKNALDVLGKWLRDNQAADHEALSKVTQILFYALYLADRPVWRELSVELCDLTRELATRDAFLSFMHCLLSTLGLNWAKVDTHRMSKLQLFVRRMQREIMLRLRSSDWDGNFASSIATMILCGSALGLVGTDPPHASVGLRVHFADTWLAEMRAAVADPDAPCGEPPPSLTPSEESCFLILLEPIMRAAAGTQSVPLMDAIDNSVFEKLEGEWFPKPRFCVRLFQICASKSLASENARRLYAALGRFDAVLGSMPPGSPVPLYAEALKEARPADRDRKAVAMFEGENDFLSIVEGLTKHVGSKEGEDQVVPLPSVLESAERDAPSPQEDEDSPTPPPEEETGDASADAGLVASASATTAPSDDVPCPSPKKRLRKAQRRRQRAEESAQVDHPTEPIERKVVFAPRSATSIFQYSEARPVMRAKAAARDATPSSATPGKAILKRHDDPRVIRKRLWVTRRITKRALALHTRRNSRMGTVLARRLAAKTRAAAIASALFL